MTAGRRAAQHPGMTSAAFDTLAAGVGRDSLATKADVAALRAEFKADMATLESRLTWRMVGIVAALLAAQGALIVALLQPAVS